MTYNDPDVPYFPITPHGLTHSETHGMIKLTMADIVQGTFKDWEQAVKDPVIRPTMRSYNPAASEAWWDMVRWA